MMIVRAQSRSASPLVADRLNSKVLEDGESIRVPLTEGAAIPRSADICRFEHGFGSGRVGEAAPGKCSKNERPKSELWGDVGVGTLAHLHAGLRLARFAPSGEI